MQMQTADPVAQMQAVGPAGNTLDDGRRTAIRRTAGRTRAGEPGIEQMTGERSGAEESRAESLKVERLRHGDDTRGWGPPFVSDAEGGRAVSAYFLTANRSKQSIALDISTPAGQDLTSSV